MSNIEKECQDFEVWWLEHQQWSWSRGRDADMPEKAPANWEQALKHHYAAGWLARAARETR